MLKPKNELKQVKTQGWAKEISGVGIRPEVADGMLKPKNELKHVKTQG